MDQQPVYLVVQLADRVPLERFSGEIVIDGLQQVGIAQLRVEHIGRVHAAERTAQQLAAEQRLAQADLAGEHREAAARDPEIEMGQRREVLADRIEKIGVRREP